MAVAGVADPRGLGDALQCSVTIKMLQKFFHEAEVTFFCPDNHFAQKKPNVKLGEVNKLFLSFKT